MRRILLKITCIVFAVVLMMAEPVCAQKNQKRTDAAKKKEQVESDYKKAYARARKLTIKHRRDIQTDATKEMMDEADKRAKEWNTKNDPSFFERWFKWKKHRKRGK
jgi:hypothetical protein